MCCRISMGITKMLSRLLPVPWTVTVVMVGESTQQSYSWRMSLVPPPLFFFHQTVMAISQGSSAMARFLQQEEERERMNKVLGQQTRNSNALRIPCGKQNFRWRTLPRNHDCLQSCLLLLGSLGLERKLAEQKSSKSSRDGHKKRTDYVLLY